MILTDKLAYSSQIRDKNPYLKTAFAVGSLILCVVSRKIVFSLLILIIMGYSTLTKSRISPIGYLKFMSIPGVFLILSSISIVFDFSKIPLEMGNLPIGSWYIGTSMADIIYGVQLMMTAMSSVSCLYFLSMTTPMQDLIMVLRRCKIPWLIIELAVLMYRFIFIIGDMTSATILAQNCRLGNGTMKEKIRNMGTMLASVFVRSYHKANRMFEAMEARNYNGQVRVLWEYDKATAKEKILLVMYFIGAIVVAVWLG